MREQPKGTVAAEVVMRDGEVKLQRPERPKPGDKVLVELDLINPDLDGERVYVRIPGYWSIGVPRDRVHPHPDCDPALLPELVAAVREWANSDMWEGYGAGDRLAAIAARMEADDADALDATIRKEMGR